MSNVSFLCPKCGRLLTASSNHAGQLIACPACFATMRVPAPDSPATHAPESATPPPATPPLMPGATPRSTPPRSRGLSTGVILGLIALGLVVLLCLMGVAGLFFARAIHGTQQRSQNHGMRVARQESRLPSPNGGNSAEQPATDPETVEVPDRPVTGRLAGEDFQLEKAFFANGLLELQGPKASGQRILIFTFTNGQDPDGTSILVPDPQGRPPFPHIHLGWKEDGRRRTESLVRNYCLRLEFGEEENGSIPCRIYLELPEQYQTKIAGTFEASTTAR